MGYKNEKATLNQFSSMEAYAKEKVVKTIEKIATISTKRDMEVQLLKPSFEYCPPQEESTICPMASVDGGIATLFPGELTETKIIRVAAGCAPEFKDLFSITNYQTFTHLFSGKLKWPEGVNQTLDETIEENVDILLENKFIIQAVNELELSLGDFRQTLIGHFSRLRGKSMEDNFREILELSMMVCFLADQKEKNVEFLLIKDGTLFPSKITTTGMFSGKVSEFFATPQPVVGVIKSSRFVNIENAWSKTIIDYARGVKSHTFFRVPKRVELMIDPKADEIPFRRYFLSLFGGESIYEIQIPKEASEKKEDAESLLKKIASQITFAYGGSIIVNSLAHEQASLSESEARFLTDNMRMDLQSLKQLLKEHSKKAKGEENGGE